jgi:hypothetical protein
MYIEKAKARREGIFAYKRTSHPSNIKPSYHVATLWHNPSSTIHLDKMALLHSNSSPYSFKLQYGKCTKLSQQAMAHVQLWLCYTNHCCNIQCTPLSPHNRNNTTNNFTLYAFPTPHIHLWKCGWVECAKGTTEVWRDHTKPAKLWCGGSPQ